MIFFYFMMTGEAGEAEPNQPPLAAPHRCYLDFPHSSEEPGIINCFRPLSHLGDPASDQSLVPGLCLSGVLIQGFCPLIYSPSLGPEICFWRLFSVAVPSHQGVCWASAVKGRWSLVTWPSAYLATLCSWVSSIWSTQRTVSSRIATCLGGLPGGREVAVILGGNLSCLHQLEAANQERWLGGAQMESAKLFNTPFHQSGRVRV